MKNSHQNTGCVAMILIICFWIAVAIGEVSCIYKAVTCNWEPIGKAEIFYTVGAFTPVGPILGYIDIQDK